MKKLRDNNIQFRIILSSCLLSRNIKIEIYKSIILLVLYGFGTYFLILRENID